MQSFLGALVAVVVFLTPACGTRLDELVNGKKSNPPTNAGNPDESSEDGSTARNGKGGDDQRQEEPGGNPDDVFTLAHVLTATEKSTKGFPRGLDDPDACKKTPAIKRGPNDITRTKSWRPPKYDMWVRIDYKNQCDGKAKKVYFWCHFHVSGDGSKYVACHARGSGTIDKQKLREPDCKPDGDCDDNSGGGIPLP